MRLLLICDTYKWAVTCDFQQCGILTSPGSDVAVQPPFRLRNSKWCSISSLTSIEYLCNKGSDQSARMRRLVSAIAGRTYHLEISCHSSSTLCAGPNMQPKEINFWQHLKWTTDLFAWHYMVTCYIPQWSFHLCYCTGKCCACSKELWQCYNVSYHIFGTLFAVITKNLHMR